KPTRAQEQIVTETVTPAAETITELFARAVDQWADKVAFRVTRDGEWHPITFGEYGAAARSCAGGLIARGVAVGDFGSIVSSNRPEWHECDLGMINAGVVSCPVYPTNSPPQIHYILEHSGSKVVFVENETQRAKIEQIRGDLPKLKLCIVFDGAGADGDFYLAWDDVLEEGRRYLSGQPGEYDQRSRAAKSDDLLAVIYTSGTTGDPKGTMLSHHNALWTLASLDQVLAADHSDRKLSFLPLSHVAERTSSEYLQLQQGFEIWFAQGIDTIGEDLKACRPTVQFVVPRILEKQYDGITKLLESLPDEQRTSALQAIELGKQRTRLEQQGQALPEELEGAWQRADQQLFGLARAALGYDALRALVSGAAPVSLDLLEFFRAIGVPVLEVYGQTEDHGPTTINRTDRYKLGTVGQVIPGGEVRLAEDGEILYRGPNVCMGYYRNDDATRELIDGDGWLHSGDIGVMDDDGFVTITDRKKDIIITAAGKNIAPQVIEQKLKFSPWVSQAVVVGDRRKFVSALITLDEVAVRQFAQQKSITYDSYEELTRHPDIVGLIAAHVAEVNNELAGVEQVKQFRVLPEDFTVDSGTITPTLKIKRKPINALYGDVIEEMYADSSA
ncbi:MAG: AMP-binding protein, partial [Nitriliruptorales bacterium]|nr:AMP-binding protein [Nitriliruptorales bacterium]